MTICNITIRVPSAIADELLQPGRKNGEKKNARAGELRVDDIAPSASCIKPDASVLKVSLRCFTCQEET